MKKTALLWILAFILLAGLSWGQLPKYTCTVTSPKTCEKGTCPKGYQCVLSGKECVCVTLKTTTTSTTSTTTTTFVTCPLGCECMTEEAADEAFLDPEKCVEGVCGYTYSPRTVAVIYIPRYCYSDGPITLTTTTTRPLTARTIPAEDGCSSCEECTNQLKSGKKDVFLDRDLESPLASCIYFSASDATLDCRGHRITGNGVGLEFYYGIEFSGSGNTIKNCIIEGFEAGIAAYGANDNAITNNTLARNGEGIWLGGGLIDNATLEVSGGSNGNTLEDNAIENNTRGIYLAGNRNTRLDGNRVCRNSVADIYTSPHAKTSGSTNTNSVCDLIYNWNGDSDVTWCPETCTQDLSISVSTVAGLIGALGGDYGKVNLSSDLTVPGGLSFDASHVTVDCKGHRITGSGEGAGFMIKNKVNVEIKDCEIKGFGTGVLMESASYSRILSNGITDTDYGILLRTSSMPSRGSNLTENVIESGFHAIHLDGDTFGNSFAGNELSGGQYSIHTTARCDNDIDESNEGGSGRKIGYLHDQTGLDIGYPTDRNYAELILCNIRNSVLREVRIDGSGANRDGVMIINSRGIDLPDAHINEAYAGIMVVNSTDINITGPEVSDASKDCVSVSGGSGVQVSDGSFSSCDTGTNLYLTGSATVKECDFTTMRSAAVTLYMSDSCTVEDNTVSGNFSFKGILLTEGSEDNTIRGNDVTGTTGALELDPTSDGNTVEWNTFCNNSQDILNNREDNTGDNNVCSRPAGWSDDGTKGCSECCVPAVSDIDNDGIDDACDCADLYRGAGETGTDCGGKCQECVDCTWCDSRIEPLRVVGRHNDGYIDIVFVPEEDWAGNRSGFLAQVKDTIRFKFLNLDRISIEPLSENYQGMLNFYAYQGGYGEATDDSASCYDPEGPEGVQCMGCKGWLPGESEYFDWVYACSFTCALSLGLGCGCFAMEPDHFWEHASFADSVGIITQREIRGCSGFGPTSHYTAAYCSNRGNVILHESSHSLFALTDEYCGDTAYSRASRRPNVWNSMGDCQDAEASEGWVNGSCSRIQDVDVNGTVTCSKDKFRYDTDIGGRDLMASGCWTGGTPLAKEADIRRINYVFDNWGGGGSKGIISYIAVREGSMYGVMSRVVPNHPDLGMWASEYVGLTSTAGGVEIDRFTFSDPTVSVVGMGANGEPPVGVHVENTTFTIIVPMHEQVRYLTIYNGSTGDLETVIDLGPAIWNYCTEVNWTDEYCLTADTDGNSVPDRQEMDEWAPEERLRNASMEDRPDLAIEPEESGMLPEREQGEREDTGDGITDETKEKEQGETGAAVTDQFILGLLAGALIIALFVIALLILSKRKRPAKEDDKGEKENR